MKSFREWLLETVEIKFSKYFSGPFISNARNFNVARKELVDHRASSKANEDDIEYRALYDTKSKKFWIWYSIDGLHIAVNKFLRLDNSLHIQVDVEFKYITAPANAMLVKLDNKDKRNILKWFGKQYEYGGPLQQIEDIK